MRTVFDRRWMIRKQGNRNRLPTGSALFGILQNRTYNMPVQILDATQLQLQVAVVSCLVTCLDMNVDEIVSALQRLDSSIRLAAEIGIPQSCGTRDLNHTQACIAANTANQVDSRYYRPTVYLVGILLGQCLHLRLVSTTPRPDAVGRILTVLLALDIQRMVFKQDLRLVNQLGYQRTCLLCLWTFRLWHELAPGLQRYIVRRSKVYTLVTTLYHQQMAILHTCMEMHAPVAQLLVQVFDQYIGILGFQASAGMIPDNITVQRHKVASQGEIAILQPDTYGCSLQRSAPLIHYMLVVTQYAAVGNLTARMETVGNGLQQAVTPHTGKLVGIRRMRMLQQRGSAKSLVVPVGHTVSQYNDMLHQASDMISAKTPAAVTPAPAP